MTQASPSSSKEIVSTSSVPGPPPQQGIQGSFSPLPDAARPDQLLQSSREEATKALAASIAPEKVTAVMEALFRRAVGMDAVFDVTVDKDTGKEERKMIQKPLPPNYSAAWRWLGYALGPPRALGGGGGRGLTISDEDFRRLEKIAAKFGKKLNGVNRAEPVIDAEYEVKNEAREPEESGQGVGETSNGEGEGQGSTGRGQDAV